MRYSLSKALALYLFAYATTCIFPAHSQTNSNSGIPSQVANLAENLLLNARPYISQAYIDISSLGQKSADIQKTEQTIKQRISDAEESIQKLQKTSDEAFFDIFKIETKYFVLDDINNLHLELLNFVPRYMVQVGIPDAIYKDPYVTPILGHTILGMRPAMGEIIDAQADDLEHIAKILSLSVNSLIEIERELKQIASSGNLPYPTLGTDHYLETLYIRLDALRRTIRQVSLFLGGLNLDAQDQEPVVCDQEESPLQSLSSQLLEIWDSSAKAQKFLGNHGFARELYEIDISWYDGSDTQIGLLQHWQRCINNKRNIAEDLRRKFEQAMAEGRTDLARETNLYRLSYLSDTSQLEADALTLSHRRRIIADRLMRAAEIQTRSDPYESDTQPWHKTVQAFSLNLYQLHGLYPPILKSANKLIDDTIGIVDSSTFPSKKEDQGKWFLDTANMIRVDNELGLYRLTTEIQSAVSSLRVMAANIRNNQSGLEQAIISYEDSSYFKLNDLYREMEIDLPREIKFARERYNDAKTKSDLEFKALDSHNANLTEFAKLKDYFLSRLDFLEKGPIRNRFLNIYETLVDTLLANASEFRDYLKYQDQIELAVQEKLFRFTPIDSELSPGPQLPIKTKKVCKKRKKKKICKIVVIESKNKTIAALERQLRSMNSNIKSIVEEASRSSLENQTLTSEISSLDKALKRIQELGK